MNINTLTDFNIGQNVDFYYNGSVESGKIKSVRVVATESKITHSYCINTGCYDVKWVPQELIKEHAIEDIDREKIISEIISMADLNEKGVFGTLHSMPDKTLVKLRNNMIKE